MVHLSRQPIHYQDLLFKAKLMETAAIFFSQMRIAQEPVPISDEHAKFALKAQQYIHKIKGKKDFTIIGLAQQFGTNET